MRAHFQTAHTLLAPHSLPPLPPFSISPTPRRTFPLQTAKLLESKDSRGMFFFDYRVEAEGQAPRTIYSVVAMGNNGRMNRLFT
jgi:hypothetical protein